MIVNMNRTMNEAMELMRAGDLHAATRAILRRLGAGQMANDAAPDFMNPEPSNAEGAHIIEGTYRVVAEPSKPENVAQHTREEAGAFKEHRFACEAGEIRYKLFIPVGLEDLAAYAAASSFGDAMSGM